MYCDKLNGPVLARSDAPVAETKKGKLAGIKKGNLYLFRGIKYADAKRFHMPEEVAGWSGVRRAVSYGCACPEKTTPVPPDGFVDPHYYVPQDENCQYLNIWTPTLERGAAKPVMIWVHGGGWFMGSATEQAAYDGESLCAFGDVVVVSFNHRHNVLGELDLSSFGEEYALSSCCGVADIVSLLRWVRDNIEAFGGDRDNVTLLSQSGGVEKIFAVMQCPEADGLYHKAAVDSGGFRSQSLPDGWTKRRLAKRLGELTAQNLGLTKETIHEIETVPCPYLYEAVGKAERQLKEESGLTERYRYEPTEDGVYLVGNTLRDGFRPETKDIPMLIGSVFGENSSNFVEENRIGEWDEDTWDMRDVCRACRERYGESGDAILSEFLRTYPEKSPTDVLYIDPKERNGQIGFVRQRSAMGAAVWNWLFTKKSPVCGGLVAWHCSELPFVFHNASYIEAAFEPGVSERLEDCMAGAWTAFARTGDPNADPRVPAWPRVTGTDLPTMIFDRACGTRVNHDRKLRELLAQAEKRKEENRREQNG